MISISVCLNVAVITLLKIVLIGGFSSHLRLSLHNYKVERVTRSECRLHSIDPSIHLDREHIADKDYDDKNNNSVIRGNIDMNYNLVKIALLKYKELHGNMLVPSSFIVPIDSTDFPEECWEMRLGSNVQTIRNTYDELIALGFDYGRLISKYSFVKSALLKYKEIYGNMLVPHFFIVPIDSTDFPEECWEMKLGSNVHNIRHNNQWADHKDELKALGFDFEYQCFTFDEIMTALLRFKQIHGNLLVSNLYVISPNNTDYPEEIRGMRLGSQVHTIRSGAYLEKKEELLAIGFIYVVRKRFDYETVRIAMFKYRELHHGATKVPRDYKISVNSTWYPEVTWGMSLGSIRVRVKYGGKWPGKYSELFE
jgi:hypothetical protein